jgi:hypothetical protein
VLDRHDLTDAEWARLEALLPDQSPQRGGRWTDHRTVLNGVFLRPGAGCRGGTCHPSTGTGRPSTTGIAAGQAMAPGSRSSMSCAVTPTCTRVGTGRWRSTPQWSVRTSTPRAPGANRPPTSPRRSSRPPRSTQGAGSNNKKSDGRPSREALGRSRGGLTSKIHLAADTRCRPISRITTAGHRHDSLAFAPVMAGIWILAEVRVGPAPVPAGCSATRHPTPLTCQAAAVEGADSVWPGTGKATFSS